MRGVTAKGEKMPQLAGFCSVCKDVKMPDANIAVLCRKAG
jgi:hypothetical protein